MPKRTEKQKQWYKENYKKILENNKKYKENNLEKCREYARNYHNRRKVKEEFKVHLMWLDAKRRAKKKGFDFTIVESDIIIPTHCPILGIELTRLDQRYSPSIDRKDSTKGYTKDNIWVISTLANKMKWDATKEELLMFAKGILSLEGGNQL